MQLTIDMTWVSLTLFAIGAVLLWLSYRRRREQAALQHVKELWKSLALALEVELECCIDFHDDPYNEGCLTRSRRRKRIGRQASNASEAAEDIRGDLIDISEYDEEAYEFWHDSEKDPWWKAD
jgi:hypothetical protein